MNDFPDTEQLVLQRIARGDVQAFAAVYNQWQDKLYSFLLRMTESPERSEDIVQEVFLRIWLNRMSLVDVGNFNAYLFRAARNHAISALRRKAIETSAKGEIRRRYEGTAQPVDEALLEKELQAKIIQLVEALPAQQRKVYQMSREQGLKATAIASELNLNIKTVETHLRLAIASIRRELTDQYPHMPVLVILALAVLLGD